VVIQGCFSSAFHIGDEYDLFFPEIGFIEIGIDGKNPVRSVDQP
jgi:hypothetical protein